MGTYTDFSLAINYGGKPADRCKHAKPDNAKFCPECGLPNTPVDFEDQLVAWATAHSKEYEIANYIEDLVEGIEILGVKWYGHDGDMRAMSLAFPDALFIMTNTREDGFMWRAFYKGGKGYTTPAIITYEPYNPEDLK